MRGVINVLGCEGLSVVFTSRLTKPPPPPFQVAKDMSASDAVLDLPTLSFYTQRLEHAVRASQRCSGESGDALTSGM